MKKERLIYASLLIASFVFNPLLVYATPPTSATSIGVKVDIKIYLKGALIGTHNNPEILMRDDLRKNGFLPLTEPYSAFPRYEYASADGNGETIVDKGVLLKTGPEAIVDWVFIELRDPNQPTNIVATRAALLQRDGYVVEVDGESAVHFENTLAGNYHLAIRHRNHLGVMTAEVQALGKTPFLLDFTNPDFPTYGTEAQTGFKEYMAMHAGDLNQDGNSIYMGPTNDMFFVFSKVLSSVKNTQHASNFILHGYYLTDLDLDGKVIFEGPGNERAKMLYDVLGDCLTHQQPNCAKLEQLPK